jgi:hypothetical protein
MRAELTLLRTKLRSKDTEIIRMQAQIDELKRKIMVFEANSKICSQNESDKQQ